MKKIDINKIATSINDLDHYIDGLYRDSIEEKEYYRELAANEVKTLKSLIGEV